MSIGIILGSGLDAISEDIINPELLYEEKKGVHKKKIIRGFLNNRDITLFSGRTHIYEAGSDLSVLNNVVFASRLKIKNLIITNAAGGLNTNLNTGDLMLILSSINLFGKFFKKNIGYISFEKPLLQKIRTDALKNSLVLKTGTYCAGSGPSYETKSEIRFLRKIGADAVGMSTIPEFYYAAKNSIRIIGISIITNILSEKAKTPVEHNEVLETGKRASENFKKLISVILNLL